MTKENCGERRTNYYRNTPIFGGRAAVKTERSNEKKKKKERKRIR